MDASTEGGGSEGVLVEDEDIADVADEIEDEEGGNVEDEEIEDAYFFEDFFGVSFSFHIHTKFTLR